MIFDAYIQAALPHVKNAGVTAAGYGDRILSRLDMILEALQSEEFIEYHPRQSFTLAMGVPQDMQQIPAGEMWELEFLSCNGPATITINEGADLFRFAKTFAAADASIGLQLIFGGGTAPTILSSANVGVTMQFKRRRCRPAKHTNAPGQIISPDVFNGSTNGTESFTERHSSPLVGAGRSVRGAMVGDGLVDPYGRKG